ncbi:hypothetical protein [Roseomonas sp. AR75]|uniref:hypothetical protein n=1 Tax=Roseomonas sp. AR75 TaxID=2562311 RepID=UPI0010C0E8E5|nr:hypothetical protein [Roseomonas sp. AR75]
MTGPLMRDLLDSLAQSLPEAGPARDRARDETLALLVAIFGPARGAPDAMLSARITRAADAVIAERLTLPLPMPAERPASPRDA